MSCVATLLSSPWGRRLRFVGAFSAVFLLWACAGEPFLFDGPSDEAFLSVEDLQQPRPAGDEPTPGREVILRSVVVTAVDGYAEARQALVTEGGTRRCVDNTGYAGGIVVQDPGGGPWGGITLFNPTVTSSAGLFVPGTLVDVRGRYVEFCLSQGRADNECQAPETERLSQLTQATVEKVGEASPPKPVEISVRELMDRQRAEAYEGVLVRVVGPFRVEPCRGASACCVGDYDRYGSLSTDSIEITNEYYAIPQGTRCLGAVTGIVTWFFDFRLAPRGPEDVEISNQCAAPSGQPPA